MINESEFRKMLPYTVQLFRKITDVEPINFEPWASAFLLELNNNYYLCTASHVYNDTKHTDVGFYIEGFFYIIEGHFLFLNTKDSSENDKADLAVCKLTEESVRDLKEKYDFLGFDNIELDHEISSKDNYIVVGYPITKTKKNTKKRTIQSLPLKLSTKACLRLNLYEKIGRDEKINILLDFQRHKLFNYKSQRLIAPKPTGISGCGLWHCTDGDFKLIGLMTEWVSKEAVLVATKIDILLGMIRDKIDDSLPQSQNINPKFE